jgi:hypothetical protein
MINVDLWARLEKIGEEDPQVKAYLLNLDDSNVSLEFLVIPSKINIKGNCEYSDSYPAFATKGYTKYMYSEFVTVDIDDLIFTVPCHNRSMLPIERQLDKLRYPLPNKLEPPSLSFVYGKRSIQPLRLKSYDIQEIDHLNGIPTTIKVDLSLFATDIPEL